MHSIDFYSGSRKNTHGGVQIEILKKIRYRLLYWLQENLSRGGGAILIPKKSGPPVTSKPESATVTRPKENVSIGLAMIFSTS